MSSELPYGDQGLFMTRRAYDKVGGFDKVYLMEDYIMVCSCYSASKNPKKHRTLFFISVFVSKVIYCSKHRSYVYNVQSIWTSALCKCTKGYLKSFLRTQDQCEVAVYLRTHSSVKQFFSPLVNFDGQVLNSVYI